MASPIVHDATTISAGTSGVSTLTVSHPVGNGTFRLLIVTAVSENTVTPANTPISTLTYAGIAMSKVNNQSFSGGNENVEQWYLLSPPVGTWDCIPTWVGTADVGLIVSSYFNVAQTPPDANAITTGTGLSFSASVTPLNNDSLIYSSLMDQSSSNTLTLDAGPTQRANTIFVGFWKEGAAETLQSGAPAAVTHSWTSGASQTYGMVITAYAPITSVPIGARYKPLRPRAFAPGSAR